MTIIEKGLIDWEKVPEGANHTNSLFKNVFLDFRNCNRALRFQNKPCHSPQQDLFYSYKCNVSFTA